ncbi:MAG: DUF6155 family protein [Candidatus Nanoarchaeia archaeon]
MPKKIDLDNVRIRKELKSLSKEELMLLLSELIKLKKENAYWLQGKLRGKEGINETMNYYKTRMKGAFNSERINLQEARRAMAEFKTISKDPEQVIELMTFYIETGTELENRLGDLYESFYDSLESVFKQVITFLNQHTELIEKFRPRLARVIERSCEGWGHRDILEELFEDLETDNDRKNFD